MRPARLLTAALTAAALLLAGCGGDEPASSDGADPTNQAAELPETWPLTGLPVADGVKGPHPVLVLKMDNTAASAPQQGLGSADLVVEELVEGGLTRLAAFFQSEIPGKVGPVRSMRASDIGIVSPVDGAMVTSGAAGVTIGRVKKAGIVYFSERAAKGFSRDQSRSAPYNLFADLKTVAKVAKEAETRPPDYLPWGDADQLPQGQPAGSITAMFSAGHTTSWTFRDGAYVNDNSYAREGDEFVADSVLALRVKVRDAGYKDPAGNFVPESVLEGKGEAMLFHDGRVVRGAWSKQDLGSPIELSTKAGDLVVPPGHVWIELVPVKTGKVTFGK